ncbi:helix-turn-helix transcriptional regulator [bacterium]|nr:helix-turn-helix transcriptional regulator [bacterium]
MDLKKQLGIRIKELRELKNFSQEYIAEKLDMNPANYWRIENGVSYPKPENIERIAQILNVKVSELFTFEHIKDFEDIKKELTAIINDNKELTLLIYKFVKTING